MTSQPAAPRTLAARARVAILGLVVLMAGAYVPLYVLDSGIGAKVFGFPGGNTLGALAFALMGFLIARRDQSNPVGWILLAVGFFLMMLGDAQLYALLVYRSGHTNLPLGPVAAWLGSTLWGPALSLLPACVLLFPDGRVRSHRWQVVLRICVALDVVFVGAQALFVLSTVVGAPVSIGLDGQVSQLSSACAGCANKALYSAFILLFPLAPLTLALGAAGLITNTIHSQGERRQQMKWFMYGAALSAFGYALFAASQIAFGTGPEEQAASAVAVVGFSALPIGAAVAVFKYRLYDIDVVISRTLVYGSLAVFITVVYIGIAVGIGALIGGGGRPNLGLSILATAIVALGFQPVRERMQRVANRLVYGQRATPYEVLSQFSEQVAESYAMHEVLPRMARVLAEGTGAIRADVWLRGGGTLRAAASWPSGIAGDTVVVLSNGSVSALPDADRVVEVRQRDELLGALSVQKRPGESLTPIEDKLIDDLAHQAGLVLKNVGLSADLAARLEDLRASRQRLVAAQDGERRRIERNLHDGAQQHLVALKVKLGLAEMQALKDPDKARATLAELKRDADEALETLRDMARGIYPPLLADKGLAAAIESQARRATVPVTVDANGIGRHAQETEAAVYFCILEALQNVQKYAHAERVTIHLSEGDGQLRFVVEDDGCGFDTSKARLGTGLTNMQDRLEALGGRLRLDSGPGRGTVVSGTIPALAALSANAS
ncbi:MAG TPA: sensor histidine kinase [Candidatus Dormibacteraeota bacterium]|nr:sensor histidine kinase [Candidatus Dormibacteraeota bacterium]